MFYWEKGQLTLNFFSKLIYLSFPDNGYDPSFYLNSLVTHSLKYGLIVNRHNTNFLTV